MHAFFINSFINAHWPNFLQIQEDSAFSISFFFFILLWIDFISSYACIILLYVNKLLFFREAIHFILPEWYIIHYYIEIKVFCHMSKKLYGKWSFNGTLMHLHAISIQEWLQERRGDTPCKCMVVVNDNNNHHTF